MESSSSSSSLPASNPSIQQFEELFSQLEILKETLNTFINFNNELITKNSLAVESR